MASLALLLAGLAMAGVGAVPAEAQRREAPPSREAVQFSFAPVVKTAAPAVVNVYVRGRSQVSSPLDEEFRRLFGDRSGAPQSSLGSGVIVSPDGIVVTNAHVVKVGGTAEIRIALADRRELLARVLVQDEKLDIAVLRLEGGEGTFPHLEFADSDKVEVGDMVLAIGNPFGVGQTVTSGIVSALDRTRVARDAQTFIQTDAAINPGNSGGALVDMAGRVVGINTAIYTRSGGGSLGIGFAIPSNLVKLIVESALTGRKLERPWLGARLNAVTREMAAALKLERVSGAVVVRVYSKGPAAEAGLEVGDVILSVDGHEVEDGRGVQYRLTTRGIGNKASLDVIRKGRRSIVELALRAPPEISRDDVRNLAGPHPFDGARVANILPSLAEELGVDENEGVIIVSVRPQTAAARWGFRQGDIIIQVGRAKIESIAGLETQLKDRQALWQLVVKRGSQLRQLQVPG